MRQKILCLIVVLLAGSACGKKKKNSGANATAKMRSVGSSAALALSQSIIEGLENLPEASAALTGGSSQYSNSVFTLSSLTIPVSGIGLVSNYTGGAAGAIADIYTCPGPHDDDCRVDLTKAISVDNLLSGASKQTLPAGTYNAVHVENCLDNSSQNVGSANAYFTARVTGTVKLDAALYYTNPAGGLSATGPAQPVDIKLSGSCGGTTPIAKPITIANGDDVTVVLYANPSGSLLGQQLGTASSTATSVTPAGNCVESTDKSTNLCGFPTTVFGTVDAATPTVETYKITFTDGAGGTDYPSALLTMPIDSSGTPFGAILTQIFDNTTSSVGIISGNSQGYTQIRANADGTISFLGGTSDGSTAVGLDEFKRGVTSTGTLTNNPFISAPGQASLNWTSTKL